MSGVGAPQCYVGMTKHVLPTQLDRVAGESSKHMIGGDYFFTTCIFHELFLGIVGLIDSEQ